MKFVSIIICYFMMIIGYECGGTCPESSLCYDGSLPTACSCVIGACSCTPTTLDRQGYPCTTSGSCDSVIETNIPKI